eukprot:Pgem_evm1s528
MNAKAKKRPSPPPSVVNFNNKRSKLEMYTTKTVPNVNPNLEMDTTKTVPNVNSNREGRANFNKYTKSRENVGTSTINKRFKILTEEFDMDMFKQAKHKPDKTEYHKRLKTLQQRFNQYKRTTLVNDFKLITQAYYSKVKTDINTVYPSSKDLQPTPKPNPKNKPSPKPSPKPTPTPTPGPPSYSFLEKTEYLTDKKQCEFIANHKNGLHQHKHLILKNMSKVEQVREINKEWDDMKVDFEEEKLKQCADRDATVYNYFVNRNYINRLHKYLDNYSIEKLEEYGIIDEHKKNKIITILNKNQGMESSFMRGSLVASAVAASSVWLGSSMM